MTKSFTFQKAVKAQEKLRLFLDGPPGSGKTYTALVTATYLAAKAGGPIALIDSERSSAKKYANLFDFDHLTLPDFTPETYTGAIQSAIERGYAVIVIDSLSHAWEGILARKDDVARRSRSNDSFGAWREVTPLHDLLIDTMLRAPAHVIATLRTKMEYLIEKNEETGKNKVAKIGLKPVQREGVDFEFDVVGDMDQEHTLIVSKSRCLPLADAVIRKPDEDFAAQLWEWLQDGEPMADPTTLAAIREAVRSIDDVEQRRITAEMLFDLFGDSAQLTSSRGTEALAWAKARASMAKRIKETDEVLADVPPADDEPAA